MSARKRTTKRKPPKAVTQVVQVPVKVIRTKKQRIKKQRLERGHWQPETGGVSPRFAPRPLDAATIIDRPRLREWVTWRLQERPDAWKSLENLVSIGCDKDFLLDALGTLALTNTSGSGFKATFRRPKREIDAVVRRMHRCAEDIDRMSVQVWGDLLNEIRAIPDVLRAGADHLGMVVLKRRKRGRRHYDEALADIVNYVRKKTEGPHNSDVARIVEAMREDAYSEEAHRDWLKKHQTLVENP